MIVTRDSYVEEEKTTNLPHPKRPNAHVTKFMVMTASLPPQEKLDKCRQEILTLSASALNPEMMAATEKKVAEIVSQALTLYHWCFYESMVVLDDKLENDGLGVRLEEMTLAFSKNMKALWILALALDEVTSSHRYFDYLRVRYVQLSRDYFARDTVIIAPPFGFSGKNLKPLPKKAVGAADVD